MPARNTKTGAQKCVTQRVRNRAGSLTSRGLKPAAAKKSRVWSSAISTMTRPRNRSIESSRTRPGSGAFPIEDGAGAKVTAAGGEAVWYSSLVDTGLSSLSLTRYCHAVPGRSRRAGWGTAGLICRGAVT